LLVNDPTRVRDEEVIIMLLKYPTCCLHNLNVFMLLLDFIYCIKELLYHKHIKKRKRITI